MSTEDLKKGSPYQQQNHPPAGGAGAGGFFSRMKLKLPFSPTTLALAGLATAGAIYYYTYYAYEKSPGKAAVTRPEDTHPRV
ncbi:hypothetical protein M9H77_13481 [Catharanthus roseus]|uniref:Uncharacterized protein n=1 Tax=Catharanthus roseus TaxID=4058 RepID=A0ACC0BKA7_CATRO|nr:hypothetical protein M9H77_13481 [Catharanthus roseus]